MYLFLLLPLIIIIAIAIIGFSIAGSVLRLLFGGNRHTQPNNTQRTTQGSSNRQSTYQGYGPTDDGEAELMSDIRKRHKKVFDKEDGEYVDYEEVKE